MNRILKISAITIGGILAIMIFSISTGYFDVFYTKTVGKAKQNAQREVYEETQSYVEGKRYPVSFRNSIVSLVAMA